jgi:IS1 family transposase
VQFDEKWGFVGRKERHCELSEAQAGDCWGHVALDPESRLVVSLVLGKRTAEATRELVADFRRRTGGRLPWLVTSDEYPAYADAIRTAYGRVVTPHEPDAGPPAEGDGAGAGRTDVRHRTQAPPERAGGVGEHHPGVRDVVRVAAGVGHVGRQPGGERGVRRTAQRHGSRAV